MPVHGVKLEGLEEKRVLTREPVGGARVSVQAVTPPWPAGRQAERVWRGGRGGRGHNLRSRGLHLAGLLRRQPEQPPEQHSKTSRLELLSHYT